MSARVVVIAGPSGSGKNTVINKLLERIPDGGRVTTATTRAPRPGETNGDDYFFYSPEEFDAAIARGEIAGQRFVPLFGGVYYGIFLPELRKKVAACTVAFAPVDITGAEYLKAEYGATTIFIMPESFTEYRTRIRSRSPEMTEREFEMRMKIAGDEFRVHAPKYDYRVVNASGLLDRTVEDIVEILTKEGIVS